jgi:UDPglucose 6-dehydrogenase
MNILVYGAGYVGLSIASVLSRDSKLVIVDPDQDKVATINDNKLPFLDSEESLFYQNISNIEAFIDDKGIDFKELDFAIICVPTNFNEIDGTFDVDLVGTLVEELLKKSGSFSIIIKSTVPIGFTQMLSEKLNTDRVIFSPEFLREGFAIHDNLFPSRIVAGSINRQKANDFINIMKMIASKKDVNTVNCSPTEAEAIKLFSNSYLAMRVAFFNELDSFSFEKRLDTKKIISSICLDPRIGEFHNNPSFGYGGYCLPKDLKQLESNYLGIPQDIISSVLKSNITRKKFIYSKIIETNRKHIGIYRLSMKAGSDNFREAAILDIIEMLRQHNDIRLQIYEPCIESKTYNGISVKKNLDEFKEENNLIIANRYTDDLKDIEEKIFSRDIYGEN